ncbi:hypothetical protein [Sphingomonas sp.]|uniref:hypothetical protein n=1 Tax=Sphingomonas sp. TaxID=28214 RepID=UPI0035BBA8D3
MTGRPKCARAGTRSAVDGDVWVGDARGGLADAGGDQDIVIRKRGCDRGAKGCAEAVRVQVMAGGHQRAGDEVVAGGGLEVERAGAQVGELAGAALPLPS